MGLPAPVVTASTLSSATSSAICGALGLMSMMFTPIGLLVSLRASSTWARTHSAEADPAAMMPRPPALLTAAASWASATQAMPP